MAMSSRQTFALSAIPVLFLLTALLIFSNGSAPNAVVAPLAPPKPAPKYPSGIPDKFDPDGNFQPFRGNTIICNLANTTELYRSLLVLYDKLEKSPLSHLYALLPPASWHMTVFEGVVDKKRKPGYWPSNLPADATLEECTALYVRELSAFDLQTKLPFHMSIVGLSSTGLGLHLEPHAEDNKALRKLRDRLADVLKIRHRGHDHYELHLSLGYELRYPTKEQKEQLSTLVMDHLRDMPKEFELGRPEFCTFEDMSAYKPLLYLENKAS